jgi:hypothetical protein
MSMSQIGNCEINVHPNSDYGVPLNTVDPSKYSVAVCVAMVDTTLPNSAEENFEVYSGSLIQTPTEFKVYCDYTTHAGDVRLSYFKKTEDDSNFQFGVFNTFDVRPAILPGPPYFDGFVPFTSLFDQPPKVFVGINGFILNRLSLRVYADNITVAGFNIHVETSGDTWEGSASITWIAFAADQPEVAIGTFRGDVAGRLPLDGYSSFDSVSFPTPPSIFTALTQFDIDLKPNSTEFHIGVEAQNAASSGVLWHIKPAFDGRGSVRSVTGAYLAFNA